MKKGQVHGPEVSVQLKQLLKPHVESFDFFSTTGFQHLVKDLEPVYVKTKDQLFTCWLDNPKVESPTKEAGQGRDRRLFPRECREANITYKGDVTVEFCFAGDKQPMRKVKVSLGHVPIMTGSVRCHTRGLNRQEMMQMGEEPNEVGGCFVINGNEKVVRLLNQTKRHYILGLKRGSHQKRGKGYTDYATIIRCTTPDESSKTFKCYYLDKGYVNGAVSIRRQEFFIPIVLLMKAVHDVSDQEIREVLMHSYVAGLPASSGGSSTNLQEKRITRLLTHANASRKCTRKEVLEYIGHHFRVLLDTIPTHVSAYKAGEIFMRSQVLQHLEHGVDKFNLLAQMVTKLFYMVDGHSCYDNVDALTHHEVLMPGHLLLRIYKERLQEGLVYFARTMESQPAKMQYMDSNVKLLQRYFAGIGGKIENMLATGNLTSRSGLDLSQSSGFSVAAEKLNFFRFIAHFRSIHRGQYYMTMRTTAIRKLLPESWGFLCPVHTPDGGPCGLLHHLTVWCQIKTFSVEDPIKTEQEIVKVLVQFGLSSAYEAQNVAGPPNASVVIIDGKVVGYIRTDVVEQFLSHFRKLKAALALVQEPLLVKLGGVKAKVIDLKPGQEHIPCTTELFFQPSISGGPYPGLYIFTNNARLYRPVQHMDTGAVEFLGPLEQHNMSIFCPDGGEGGSFDMKFTHREIHTSQMLSLIASITPLSDFNQSPRSMYQCQMGKQTMGSPCLAWPYRNDIKMYRLLFPQSPLCRADRYDIYHFDEYPQGTNVVLTVMSHTGYDMEDAMILNQSAVDRGLFHGILVKTERIALAGNMRASPDKTFMVDLNPLKPFTPKKNRINRFGVRYPINIYVDHKSQDAKNKKIAPTGQHRDADVLDTDGLPKVGAILWPKAGEYSVLYAESQKIKPKAFKGDELAIIDQVSIIGHKQDSRKAAWQHANIKMRIQRNPVMGDKFASRAGQKGIMGMRWKDIDLPWSVQTGCRPDLVFNPHGMPSRMTIGMMIEILASKMGALTGTFTDVTPFQKCDLKKEVPVEQFADTLEQCGFQKYGREWLHNGYTGIPMEYEIYVGICYYQRLRHMVSDKYQVRSTGPINTMTRQPVKGRAKGGGIRLGEMERDSLIAHGAEHVMFDRLNGCSDCCMMYACSKCGSIVTPQNYPPKHSFQLTEEVGKERPPNYRCCDPACNGMSKDIKLVILPYVYKVLAVDLLMANIRCQLRLDQ